MQGKGQPKAKQPNVDKAQETIREMEVHPLIKKEFAQCMYKNCFRKLRVATDQEARNIVQTLEQVRKNPEQLKEQG
eukprot:922780-Ditylum_brightwellii.AAC.1